jgi:hypothetical protein
VTGRVCEKIAQNVAQPVFCHNESHNFFPWKKVDQKFGLPTSVFKKNCPNKTIRPIGENPTNLATLRRKIESSAQILH